MLISILLCFKKHYFINSKLKKTQYQKQRVGNFEKQNEGPGHRLAFL